MKNFKALSKKKIDICYQDAQVVLYSLAQRLKAVNAEISILKLTRDRDLTREERWQLPAHLQQLTQKELEEQIDAWITLQMAIEGLIKDFQF